MGTRRATLLLTVLVLLAGCAGAGVSPPTAPVDATTSIESETTSIKTETITTEPQMTADTATLPTDTTTSTDITTTTRTTTTTTKTNATLPPGASGSGIEDAEALVAAHREALNETGFSFRFQANVSVGPTVQWTAFHGTVEAGLSPLLVHSTSVRQFNDDTTEAGTDLWANATTVVVQYHEEDRTDLRWYNRSNGTAEAYDETWGQIPRADLESQVTQSWLIELALTVGDYHLARTERRDGRLFAVFQASEPVAGANFSKLNATVVVDSEGRVHAVELTASAEGDDAIRVHYEFELTEVGNVTASQPKWVETATVPDETEGSSQSLGPAMSPHPPRSSRLAASVRV